MCLRAVVPLATKMKLQIKRLLSVCLCLFALTLPTMAGSLSDSEAALDAERALDAGDYARAAELLRALAEQGFAQAQLKLGFLYAQGAGVPRDPRFERTLLIYSGVTHLNGETLIFSFLSRTA